MKETKGWSSLRIAVACRLHVAFKLRLQRGADPLQLKSLLHSQQQYHEHRRAYRSKALESMEAATVLLQAACEPPPWEESAPPELRQRKMQRMQKMVMLSVGPWCPSSHWYYSYRFRAAVITIYRVAERIRRVAEAAEAVEAAESDAAAEAAEAAEAEDVGIGAVQEGSRSNAVLPVLPPEIWTMVIIPMFTRADWMVLRSGSA